MSKESETTKNKHDQSCRLRTVNTYELAVDPKCKKPGKGEVANILFIDDFPGLPKDPLLISLKELFIISEKDFKPKEFFESNQINRVGKDHVLSVLYSNVTEYKDIREKLKGKTLHCPVRITLGSTSLVSIDFSLNGKVSRTFHDILSSIKDGDMFLTQ